MDPCCRQKPWLVLKVGISASDRLSRREQPICDGSDSGYILTAPAFLSHGNRTAVPPVSSKNAAFHGQLNKVGKYRFVCLFQHNGTFDVKASLYHRENRIGKIPQAECLQFLRHAFPIQIFTIVQNKRRNIQIHPDSGAGSGHMLCNMGNHVQEMIFRHTGSIPSARLKGFFCQSRPQGDTILLSIPLHRLHPNNRISRKRIHVFPVLGGPEIRLFCGWLNVLVPPPTNPFEPPTVAKGITHQTLHRKIVYQQGTFIPIGNPEVKEPAVPLKSQLF